MKKFEFTLHWKFGKTEKTRVYQFATKSEADSLAFTMLGNIICRLNVKYDGEYSVEPQLGYVKFTFNKKQNSVTFYAVHAI